MDPLFLTEGARFYDLDEDRAEAVEPITFEVRDKDSRESNGTVRVRFAVMPPTFARVDKTKDARGKNANERFPILVSHNGLVVLRAGRQIDVVRAGLPTTFGNNDRYIGVEVDFPPALDEYFGVTTHKQQITLSDNDDQDARCARRVEDDRPPPPPLARDARRPQCRLRRFVEDDVRPSEVAMDEAAQLDPIAPDSERRTKQADEGRREGRR